MAYIQPRKNKNGIITSYTIQVSRGYDENGKKLKPYTRSYPDKKKGETIPTNWNQAKIEKEVHKIATLFEEECKKGNVSAQRIKFSTFAKEYLDMMYKTKNLKVSTIDTYNNYLERINDINLDGIGHIELDKITTPMLNKFYLSMSDKAISDNRKGKGLSSNYIKKYHGFISSVMTYACKQGIINSNPCQYATIPNTNANKDEKEIIENKDIHNVLLAINKFDIKWQVFFYIAFTTGARLGEILGIQFCDINFENNTIHLHNNVQYRRDYKTREYNIYIDTLKTRQARTVQIPSFVSELIKQYAEQRKIINLNSTFWLFAGTTNQNMPMYPSAAKRQSDNFKNMAIVKKQIKVSFYNRTTKENETLKLKVNDVVYIKGYSDNAKNKFVVIMGDRNHPTYVDIDSDYFDTLPQINPHKFRHTFASILNYNNLDIVTISKSLGHTQVSTTTDIYSHTFNKLDKRSVNIFDNIISQQA